MGKYIYGEQEQPVKPAEFTHWRVLYKSTYGGNSIIFIPADKDLDTELDKIEDNAGIIDISEVTRTFTTRSRLVARFEGSCHTNRQNNDTDAQLSGIYIH